MLNKKPTYHAYFFVSPEAAYLVSIEFQRLKLINSLLIKPNSILVNIYLYFSDNYL